MATPKMEAIITEFSRRIGDPVTISGSTFSGMKILTKDEFVAYANKAMLTLFNRYWEMAKGDKKLFVQIFPELAKTATITLSGGSYTIVSPNLDFFVLLEGSVVVSDGVYKQCSIIRKDLYYTARYGYVPQYTGNSSHPAIVESNGIITVFSGDSYNSKNVDISFIKQPVAPNTGGFLVQDGTYDSPFTYQWNSKIAEIAEQLFKQEAQETS